MTKGLVTIGNQVIYDYNKRKNRTRQMLNHFFSLVVVVYYWLGIVFMCILYCCEGRKLDNSLGYYVTLVK